MEASVPASMEVEASEPASVVAAAVMVVAAAVATLVVGKILKILKYWNGDNHVGEFVTRIVKKNHL